MPPRWNEYTDKILRRLLIDGPRPASRFLRHIMALIPSGPRCKICNCPFHGVGGFLMRLVGKGKWSKNPRYCESCLINPESNVVGIDANITMLFVDVRGSTALAERRSPKEFTDLMSRFYEVVTDVLARSDALIDKIVGDEVIGLFVPGLGKRHSQAALRVAFEILRATGHGRERGPWIPAGIGIHTDDVYMSLVGSAGGVGDLTALGSGMNLTARLVSEAEEGEIVVSEATSRAAGIDTGDLEHRTMTLKGIEEPVTAVILNAVTPNVFADQDR